MAAGGDAGTDYLVRRVISLGLANQPQPALIADLIGRLNADGGVGAHRFYISNPLDTAFLLLALKSANSTDAATINGALSYLAQSKSTTAAWGVQEQDRIYVTAYVLLAADAWKNSYSVGTVTAPAKDWLLAQRTTGQFATATLNAISLLALATQTNDANVLPPLITALKTAQDANGSWVNDPYVTALALRALWFVGQSAPSATTGEVLGSVVDDATNQSLADATIQLVENTALSTTSSTAGSFSLTGIPAGSYTLRVSKLGYDAKQATLQVVAGQSINLGAVRLKVSAFTATVSGVIKDQNGTVLADVLVSVGANNATTNAAGQYQIAGIASGSATITATKTNYQTVNASVAFEAGKAYIFSPTIYYSGYTPAAPSLKGKVVDVITNAAISGATLTLGQSTQASAADGTFEFTALSAGAFSLGVSASTYQTVTATGSLVAGPNDIGSVALAKAAATSSISGVVVDASTNTPVAGALVAVQGTALTATSGADGKYAIAGITTTSFKLLVSAASYLTSTQNISLQQVGVAVIDIKLIKSQPSGITLESVKTSKPIYSPNEELQVDVELRNTQTTATDVVVEALIIDAQNSVALQLKANAKGLGVNPPNLPISLGAASVRLVPMSKFLIRQAAGTYTAVVRVIDTNGLVIGEGKTTFNVTGQPIMGGGLTIDPPLAQAGTGVPVHFTAQVGNFGNQPIPAGDLELVVTLTNPDTQTSTVAQTSLKTLATGAPLNQPRGLVSDASGNVYSVSAAGYDGRIFKIDMQGQISVVATIPSTLRYIALTDLALDGNGTIWVSNYNNNVYSVSVAGAITEITLTQLDAITGIDIDSSGNLILSGTGLGQTRLVRRTPQGNESVLWANGLSLPMGLVKDMQGNFIVTNSGDGTLTKVNAAGQIVPFISGLSYPQGIAIDGSGALYVLTVNDGSIIKIVADGTRTVFATGLSQPADIKLDASGNIYVSNQGDSTILKFSPSGVKEVFAKGIANGPQGMAYDAAGNLYIANDDGTLRVKDAADNVTTLATGLSAPRGVAIAADGNVLVANGGNGTITKHVGATTTTIASNLSFPYGIAIDNSGAIMVAERNTVRLSQLDASGTLQRRITPLLNSPFAVRTGATGNVYVQNTDSITIIEGGVARIFFSEFGVGAMTADPVSGGLAVIRGNDIYRIASNGVAAKLATMPFYSTGGIGMDAQGNIVVPDYYGNKLQKLDSAGNFTAYATLPNTLTSVVSDLNGTIYALAGYNLYRVAADGSLVTILSFNDYPYWINTTANNKLVTYTSSGSISQIEPDTGARTSLFPVGYVPGGTQDSTGKFWVANNSENQLVTYDSSGNVIARLSGFSSPLDIIWTGTEFQFVDTSYRLFKLAPNGYPVRIGSGFYASNFMTMRNGVLHGTYGSQLYRWDGTQSVVVPGFNGAISLSGLAARGDGSLSVADNRSSRVVALDTSNTVIKDFAGIVSPKGLAFDAQGRLYVANPYSNTIARFDVGSRVAKLFVNSNYPNYLSFDPNGNLWVTRSGGVDRVNSQGVATSTTAGNIYYNLGAITSDASGAFAIDLSYGEIRKLNGSQWDVFAAGLSYPSGVRVANDGSIFVANSGNGTVTKLSAGALTVVAGNLQTPYALDTLADGGVIVAGAYGAASLISSNGQVSDLKLASLVANNNLYGVAARPDGKFVVAGLSPGTIYELAISQSVASPAAGTVSYRATKPVNAIPVGEALTTVDFGTWVPPYGGDFKAEVRRTGLAGMVNNFLHVGSYAEGSLSILGEQVSPGDQTVPLQLKLTGADFTSLSRVETALIQPTVTISAPNGMAGDRAGNVYFTDGTSLKKTTPANVTTDVATGLQTRFGLAADSQERFYLPSFNVTSGNYDLVRVLKDGTKKVVADLATPQVNGVGVNSRDEIFVGSPGKLLKVNPDTGAVTVASTVGIPSPRGIAIDGRDNIYVQNESSLVTLIKPDGSGVTLFSKADGINDPYFEGDGYPNIAADCADNFYIAPFVWARIGADGGEENRLAQVIARTGQVGQLFNGLQISPYLNDIDYLSYDRFANRILMWNHGDSKIWQVPVTCGAISVEAHVLAKAGQTLTGFSRAPSASIPLADGRTEYVWSLRDVTTSGFNINFSTLLKGLTLGEVRNAVDSGFIAFKNTFSPTDVRVSLDIPAVRVGNLVTVGVTTDKPEYAANTSARVTTSLTNTNTRTITGQLQVDVFDTSGLLIAHINQEGATIAAGAQITVTGFLPIGTTLPATYTVRATLTDAGVPQASSTTTFSILPDRLSASAQSNLVLDKLAYNPSDRATFSSRATNLSSNLILTNLTLSVQVTDSTNTVLFTKIHTINQLLAGASQDFSVPYLFQNLASGTYTVTQTLKDATGRIYDTQTALFNVGSTAITGFGLSGTIAATPKETYVGDTVKLDFAATNTGNTDLTAVALKISIVDPVTSAVLAEIPSTATIAKGQTVAATANWPASGTEGNTLVAVLSGTVNTQTLNLAQTTIKLLTCVPGSPSAFTFASLVGVTRGAVVASNSATLAGLACHAPVSIAGGLYSINGSAFTNGAGYVKNGDTLIVQQTSSALASTTTTATLTVASLSVPFTVTTTVDITTPNPFAFTPQVDVPFSTLRTSNTVTISGITIAVPITIVNGSYSVNGGAFTSSAGTVKSGDTVTVQQTSSALGSTKTNATLTVGGFSAGFAVTTKADVTTPNPFAFTPQVDVPVSSLRTSNTVTIAGITVNVPITITNGSYSINGGSYTTLAGTVKSGDTVTVQQTSSAQAATKTTATLTVGGFSAGFAVTTKADVTTPNPFAFTAQVDVPVSSLRTSNTVTISGITVAVPITITNGTYSINGGSYTAVAGTVKAGDTVTVQQTSSAQAGVKTTATVTIGGVAGTFDVTTKAAVTPPDPFTFTPQTDVPLNTVRTSNIVTISGINAATAISVTNGTYSINGGAFTAVAGTVKAGDTVTARLVSSADYAMSSSAIVTVGTVSSAFIVTTIAKPGITQMLLGEARILVMVSCPGSSEKSQSADTISGNAVIGNSGEQGDSATGEAAISNAEISLSKSDAKSDDKDDNDDSTCAKTRKQFIDQYLTSLGVEFTSVTNVNDFKRELRCGKYNTYWISGGFAKLKGTLDDELAEAVSRGESLIVDGVYDSRNKLIDEVSGAKYNGVISGNDHQVVLSGAVMPTGTFTTKGRAAKTTFTDATVHGRFDNATSTNTAIASDVYGLGKALTFAFDWVATAQQAASAVTAKEAMKRGIALIAPSAPTDFTPNEYVRLKTSVANPATTAGTFEVAATLPPSAVFASSVPAPTSITGNIAKWRITAPAANKAEVVYSFRTPTQDSVQALTTTVSSVVDTALTEIAAKSTALAVTGFATRSALVKTQITALNPTPAAEKQARDKAVSYLADANTKRNANSLQKSIDALLLAQGELDKIKSLNTQTLQVQVGLLLKTVSREFCLSGQSETTCGSTGAFSGNGEFDDEDNNDGKIKLIRVRGGGTGSPSAGFLGGNWQVGALVKQSGYENKSLSNFSYVSGKAYNWTFEYKGNGQMLFSLIEPNRQSVVISDGSRWKVTNALKFLVHADAGIGAAVKIESNIQTLNGVALTGGTLATTGNNVLTDLSKVLVGPSLKQPFKVTGTLTLTYSAATPPNGDKLYFQISGGEAECGDEEKKDD